MDATPDRRKQQIYHPVLFQPVTISEPHTDDFIIPSFCKIEDSTSDSQIEVSRTIADEAEPASHQCQNNPRQPKSNSESLASLSDTDKKPVAEGATGSIKAYDVAIELINKLPMKLVNGALYIYNGRVYQFMTQEVMHRKIMETCEQYVRAVGNASIIRQVYELIRVYPGIAEDGAPTDSNLLSCTNGLLNLATGKLYPHTPKPFVTAMVSGAWLPEQAGNCPYFKSFYEL